ncbi:MULTISPECIES: macrolide 2'-phosphotransferase [unclassified Brachybacterium]|uniref:macrolide 2'-phosphotransferase n=1 Tax=unclassified Brachybacterium TaxID=2623841 RepID=UPI003F9192B7
MPPATAAVPPADLDALLELGSAHGLDLDGSTLHTEEIGLDFRVAIARAADGKHWVLRIPRRPDVLERAAVEGRLLKMVGPHLGIAVPDWQISTSELIAYPLLPGAPGLSVERDGTVIWHVDMSSPVYATSLGTAVSQLHAVGTEAAAATGIEVRSPRQVREGWQRDLEQVAAEFEISATLRERWTAWIAEDSFWPQHSVLTHGEIYPGHTLVEDDQITAILDWTTAAIGDPAKDLMFHQVSAPADAFETALQAYTAGGGHTWPRLAEHCTEMFSAGPIAYGLFALTTGEAAHREAAAAALNPPAES